MRAKISAWARGLAVVAAAGAAIVFLGAGTAGAQASHPVSHTAATAPAAQPNDLIWT